MVKKIDCRLKRNRNLNVCRRKSNPSGKLKCGKGFKLKIPEHIGIEKTTHGYLVTGDWGDTEIDFFNKKKEAQKFVKEEFGKCKKI